MVMTSIRTRARSENGGRALLLSRDGSAQSEELSHDYER